MLRNAVILLMTAALSLACAGVSAYRVEPVKAAWSGRTHRGDTVSEIITCNFDSLSRVELFAGAKGNGGAYRVGVWLDNHEVMWSYGDTVLDHGWIRFERWSDTVTFTKGKVYEFRFSRTGLDSIQFYYQVNDLYPYGLMIVPGQVPVPIGLDLAMRVYGRMRPGDRTYWTMDPGQPVCWWDPDWGLRDTWIARIDSSGVGAIRFEISWPEIQPESLNSFNFANLDTNLLLLKDAGCGAFVLLDLTAKSASTSFDTIADTWCIRCPPSGLFYPETSPYNYWARFLDTVVKHCDSVLGPGHALHAWEIWNEPNDTESYWRRPDRRDYTPGHDSLPGLCSLYVRLCDVAATVIRGVSDGLHRTDTILVGSMASMRWSDPWVKGSDWIRTVYDIAGTNVPWTGVSLHPYQWPGEFDPDTLEADCDTVRAIMGNKVGVIWNTEIGWDTADHSQAAEERNARNLCKTYVTSKASEARPAGGYDRVNWWLFRERFGASRRCGYFPLWDSTLTDPYMSFYACRQMTQALNGKRFNYRVMDGDTTVDNHVRMYEFEDPATLRRTWVCWRNGDVRQGVSVKLPVRTDSIAAESLAYTNKAPAFSPRVANDGWLSLTLNPRPVFIREVGYPQRPDLRVDSVRHVQASRSIVRAWVTNHGDRSTPVRSGSRTPYPTWAILKADGNSLAQAIRRAPIAVNQQVEFTFTVDQTKLPDTALLSVAVNPSQTYVELGTDDNTGYTLAVKH